MKNAPFPVPSCEDVLAQVGICAGEEATRHIHSLLGTLTENGWVNTVLIMLAIKDKSSFQKLATYILDTMPASSSFNVLFHPVLQGHTRFVLYLEELSSAHHQKALEIIEKMTTPASLQKKWLEIYPCLRNAFVKRELKNNLPSSAPPAIKKTM